MRWGMAAVLLAGLLLAQPVSAASTVESDTSVITPQLLNQVDELLATDRADDPSRQLMPMGTLVSQADHVSRLSASQTGQVIEHDDLSVTAVPLPDAFAMSAVLLLLLLVAWCWRRWRLAI